MIPTEFENLSILTVDDSPQMLGILRECLRAFGAKKILEARDAVDAFEIIRANTVDLAIVDYLMQPLDGLEFTKIVRGSNYGDEYKMPIIILTAYTEREKIIAARDAGITDFLMKPISAASLHDRILAAVNSKRDFVETKKFIGPDRRRRQKDGLREGQQDRRSPSV
jgi:two-component system, chemotaxis family, chemotaxis protein CheY